MERKDIQTLAKKVSDQIGRVIVGKRDTVELLLTAMIARGHVLLEDVPGTGKTVMAKSLAKSLSCDFSRIQFTPDLLPSDVTGLSVYSAQTGEFEFKPGPVFTNVLLADEINRATPRTQSALLECMEERQVTVDGVTRPLTEPFLVVATTQEALQILDRFIEDNPLQELTPVAGAEEIREAQRLFTGAYVSEPVRAYIVALCEKTRELPDVATGVSPRGMLSLLRACQAYALVRGRDFVTPDDVKALAVPVLAHRVILSGLLGRSAQAEDVVRESMSAIQAPTESPERA